MTADSPEGPWASGVPENGLSGSRFAQKGSARASTGNHVGPGRVSGAEDGGGVGAGTAGRVRRVPGPEREGGAVGSGEAGRCRGPRRSERREGIGSGRGWGGAGGQVRPASTRPPPRGLAFVGGSRLPLHRAATAGLVPYSSLVAELEL